MQNAGVFEAPDFHLHTKMLLKLETASQVCAKKQDPTIFIGPIRTLLYKLYNPVFLFWQKFWQKHPKNFFFKVFMAEFWPQQL